VHGCNGGCVAAGAAVPVRSIMMVSAVNAPLPSDLLSCDCDCECGDGYRFQRDGRCGRVYTCKYMSASTCCMSASLAKKKKKKKKETVKKLLKKK